VDTNTLRNRYFARSVFAVGAVLPFSLPALQYQQCRKLQRYHLWSRREDVWYSDAALRTHWLHHHFHLDVFPMEAITDRDGIVRTHLLSLDRI